MRTNLSSDSFKTLKMKINDFYLVMRSDIVLGITEREVSKFELSREISSFVKYTNSPKKLPALRMGPSHKVDVSNISDPQDEICLLRNEELEAHQSLEEQVAGAIKVSPHLEAIIMEEKLLMYAIIFRKQTENKLKCCKCCRSKTRLDVDDVLDRH